MIAKPMGVEASKGFCEDAAPVASGVLCSTFRRANTPTVAECHTAECHTLRQRPGRAVAQDQESELHASSGAAGAIWAATQLG
jgi:hypothetical protein